jgi:hypothetical protein
VLVRAVHASRPQRPQRPLGALPAVDAGRSEKDDRVLNLLILEAAQGLEVLGEDPNRARLRAFQELRMLVGHRLLRHIPPLYQL